MSELFVFFQNTSNVRVNYENEISNYIIANRVLKKTGHVWFELTKIYGVGRSRAMQICDDSGIDPHSVLGTHGSDALDKIREALAKYRIEGELRKEVKLNIQRLVSIACHRGLRHRKGNVPVRGQRTVKVTVELLKG